MDYFLPIKEGQTTPLLNPVYDGNKAAIAAWTAPGANTAARTANYYPGTLVPMDLATIPGTAGLPTGWASGLGLDSPYASGQAGSPLPFARGGTLSPRNFASIMLQKSASARAMKYALPGLGVGVDGFGLVTGALAQTSLYAKIVNLASGKPAQVLDGYYQTGTSPSPGYRLTRSDLEKVSLLVPGLDQVQVGDLVVHYGDKEGQSGDPTKVGIVVYVPASGLPAPGMDPTEFLKQVVIVGANEGEGQVSLSTWISNGTSKGFTSYGAGLCARRLVGAGAGQVVVERSIAPRGRMALARDVAPTDPGTEKFSLLIENISSLKLAYQYSYDMSYTGQKETRQRWIPNTGEYLVLENLTVVATTELQATRDLRDALGSTKGYYIQLGANDRGYDAARKDQSQYGNIYCNTGSGFELAALESDAGASSIRISDLYNNKDLARSASQAEWEYVTDYSKSDVYTSPYEPRTTGTELAIENGKLMLKREGKASIGRFGIRPMANKICPGDDILLTLRIVVRTSLPGLEDKDLAPFCETGAESYLAVYDKKALWRANLFLDEPTNDWNDLLPWVTGNEWNVKFDATSTTGMSTNVGNGGQVVHFPDVNWYYGTASDGDPEKNVHLKIGTQYAYSIAYDHQGWDTPFSYLRKMYDQGLLLNQYYALVTDTVKTFKLPVYKWDNTGMPDTSAPWITKMTNSLYPYSTSPAGTAVLADFKKYRDLIPFTENSINRWGGSTDGIDQKRGTKSLYWPQKLNKWEMYIFPSDFPGTPGHTTAQTVGSPYNTSAADDNGGGGSGFVPRLSFANGTPKACEPTNADGGVVIPGIGGVHYPYVPGVSDALMQSSNYPFGIIAAVTAGGDCNNLVQRAYTYSGSKYAAIDPASAPNNSYYRPPLFWDKKNETSGTTAIPKSSMSRMAGLQGGGYAAIITSNIAPEIPKYEKIVPGDVICYYEKPSSGPLVPLHIMMVASIDKGSGANETITAQDVHIIECVYSNSAVVYGAANKRTLATLISEGGNHTNWMLMRLVAED